MSYIIRNDNEYYTSIYWGTKIENKLEKKIQPAKPKFLPI